MESTPIVPMEVETPTPLPMRVFEVQYVDGTKEHFSSHFYDASTGQLVLIDRTSAPDTPQRFTLWHRRTIAAGQWRQITEVTGATSSSTPQ